MSKPAQLIYTTKIIKILKIQLVLITTFTLIVYMSFGKSAAQAYIIGSLIAWMGHYIFTVATFKYVGAKSSVVTSMYIGQVLKWLFSIVSLVLSIYYLNTLALQFLLLGFVVAQLKNWLFFLVK